MRAARRDLAVTVAECVLGALLSLLAVSRTWRVVTETGPVRLPGHRLTGGAVLHWAPAVALVALAGAAAIVAVRACGGTGRRRPGAGDRGRFRGGHRARQRLVVALRTRWDTRRARRPEGAAARRFVAGAGQPLRTRDRTRRVRGTQRPVPVGRGDVGRAGPWRGPHAARRLSLLQGAGCGAAYPPHACGWTVRLASGA